jgi:Fic family protein
MSGELFNAANVISTKVVTYDNVLAWWKSNHASTFEDYCTVLDNFNVLFAYNSSNIENIPVSYHMTRELFSDGKVTNFTGDVSHILELQNQKFATEYLLKNLADKRKLDKEFILKLHKIMLHGCYDEKRWKKGERPGKFKQNDYCVGVTEVGSFPDEVDGEIDELIDSINTTECDVLVGAAFLHLSLENIHPFADGNGRVGRAIMNYYLMLNDYPPTVIFNEDKETYYMALEVFDKASKMDGFVQFIKEQTVKTWKHRVK